MSKKRPTFDGVVKIGVDGRTPDDVIHVEDHRLDVFFANFSRILSVHQVRLVNKKLQEWRKDSDDSLIDVPVDSFDLGNKISILRPKKLAAADW